MINSQVKVLEQAEQYLLSTTEQHYTQIIKPQFISSAGAHIRHILDHYSAIMSSLENKQINYDLRSRGGAIEHNIQLAIQSIKEIKTFLTQLSKQQLQQQIQLATEINLDKKEVAVVNSTLAREIIFVGSHAIHHFAMIEQITKLQHTTTPEQFGIAPATATFLRS